MGCITSKAKPSKLLVSQGPPKQVPKGSFEKKYRILKRLGKGPTGEVHECINKHTKKKAAAKVLDWKVARTGEQWKAFEREVSILKELDHPHIVHLVDYFWEPDRGYIVMEMCEGGDLLDRIIAKGRSGQRYTEKEARDVIRIMFEAIDYCHSRNIVHRDLTPENILLEHKGDDAKIKIADFGVAKHINVPGTGLQRRCGSLAYAAPEVLDGSTYGVSVDNWSAGVISYILLGGSHPFQSENDYETARKIRSGKYVMERRVWRHVSEDAKDMIRHLLVVDPSQRLTAKEVLQHPWMQTHDDVVKGRCLAATLEAIEEFDQRRRVAEEELAAAEHQGDGSVTGSRTPLKPDGAVPAAGAAAVAGATAPKNTCPVKATRPIRSSSTGLKMLKI